MIGALLSFYYLCIWIFISKKKFNKKEDHCEEKFWIIVWS